MKNLVTILAMVAVVAGVYVGHAQAALDIPASGTFDIDGDAGISFDTIPYMGYAVYLYPFASDDGSYTTPYSEYNLAEVRFEGGSISVTDEGPIEGYLGVRIANQFTTQTFQPSILTLDLGEEAFDVYLPEFTFDNGDNMFFWVAQSGATYYASSSKDVGFPDISATHIMAAGDEYLARTPEPATVVLLALGAVLLRRRKFLFD
jgi:hypothetical protein